MALEAPAFYKIAFQGHVRYLQRQLCINQIMLEEGIMTCWHICNWFAKCQPIKEAFQHYYDGIWN